MEPTSGVEDAVDSTFLLESIAVDSLIEQRVSPGMLVLAPPMRLLHMNQHAWEMIRNIPPVDDGNAHVKHAKGLLPECLHEICAGILESLRDRSHAKDWERFEVKRVVGSQQQPILIRGFGVPDLSGREHSRVVLLLEAIGRRKEALNGETTRRLQLTEREQAVLQCLANGWTNKEIASALSLALPTVKEHIRHIMDKTSTTTRTGILAQVFRTGGPTLQ